MNTARAELGSYVRGRRLARQAGNRERFTLRQVAGRIGVEPSYLSKLERGWQAPLSEAKLVALAHEIEEDPDVLLAMAGKVSSELLAIITRRPRLFAQVIRELDKYPDDAVLTIVREVRDGDW